MYRQTEKIVKQQYVPHMPSQYGEVGPLTAEIGSGFGAPHKLQRGSRLGFVTAATSLNGNQPNFARCLAVCWAGEGATYIPRAAITLGIGLHSSSMFTLQLLLNI